MFIRNYYYTGKEIVSLKNDGDIIFIEGLSFNDQELLEDWSDIHLRYYTMYRENDGVTHHMFTLIERR